MSNDNIEDAASAPTNAASPEDHLKRPEKNNTTSFRAWAEIQEDQISGEANRRIKAFNAGLEAPDPNATFAWAIEQRVFSHFYLIGCLSYIIDRQNERLAFLEKVVGGMLSKQSQELAGEVNEADGGDV